MTKLSKLSLLGIALTAMACTSTPSDGTIECDRLTINLDPDFYDRVIECSERPKTVVLKEDDNTLFAEARKILVRNNKIFVLDPFDGRTAVSFTMDGEPYARYGRAGNGPGEYFRPWDIDVDSTGVYILDSNHKKVLKYSIEGDFIKDFDIPFFSHTFTLLDNGHFVFNLPEDGTAAPQLCVADSTVTDIKYYLSYKE
ncbi:MAG: 6-bladed beta-propeller [Rikenellaceae bacterium]|nr:6-bladed beta-propeller [Rikenellaceae bacterium]